MGTRNPNTIIATIEYDEYGTVRELLSKHDIESVIKPNQVDEKGEPVGTLVDVYVPLLSVRKAQYLLSGNSIDEYTAEEFTAKTMTGHVVKTLPFLNKPIPVWIIYILLSASIIALCLWAALNGKRPIF